MSLDKLLNSIKDIMLSDNSDIENLNELIKLASAGDLKSKNMLKVYIKKYLADILDKEHSTVDGYIKQYHINYFEPVYKGDDRDYGRVINSICISGNSDRDKKIDLLIQIIYQELYGLSVIDPYSYGDMEGLNEINVNSADFISFQVNGKRERVKNLYFKDNRTCFEIIKKSISNSSDDDLRPNNPEIICDNLSGARVTALIPPYSREPSLNLRYEDYKYISSENLIVEGTSTKQLERFMDIIMKSRPNILVVGPQSAGKTTYLLRLISSIPDNLTLLTMESSFELAIRKYFPDKDVKNLKFLNIKSPMDCFKTGLRLGRDIMIDGEVRTPEEAYITLQAMTRQNRGSLGSFHTSSIKNFIPDYKNMLMQNNSYKSEESALYDIARAVDIVIFIALNLATGKRYIQEVTEVIFRPENYHMPYELNPMFERREGNLALINPISQDYLNEAFSFGFTEKYMEELKALYGECGIDMGCLK
ncbi:ATPase, T2SS/T4P/T4SS family [Clostridium sp. MT-14]|jgi:pilus assembly protein CpaF|uniref:CpaF/VirB11 family protein n=1 Tax=Clostridium aromativorans TaxID=2836848 RepID=A0ABS8NAF5_9CLOT|nr:ATPase, T2SS/T4P/T4SS family [Clostridium aromativorans]MCC9296792.1 CpaF/VirB11 family protein [Clostridium aromativorans]CAB1249239.1 Type II secretion system protein E [Clostridiaceae bacterium BL-3]